MQTTQRRAWERPAEPPLQERVYRSDAERPNAQSLDGVRFEGLLDRRTLSALVETPRE